MPYLRSVPQSGMYSYLGASLSQSAAQYMNDSLRDIATKRFPLAYIARNLNYRWGNGASAYANDASARQSAITLAGALINAGLPPTALAADLAAAAGYATPRAPTPITSITPPAPPPSVGGTASVIPTPPPVVTTVGNPSPSIAPPPTTPVNVTIAAPALPALTVAAGTSPGTPLDTTGPVAAGVAGAVKGVSPVALIALALVGFLALPKSKGSRRH